MVVLGVGGRALAVQTSAPRRRRYWSGAAGSPQSLRADALYVVTLGDSLTQGTGSSTPRTSWVGRFIARLSEQSGRPVRLENRAVYGSRAADVLATQLPVPERADLVTVCVGSNDAGRTPPEVFRDQLAQICDQLPPGSLVGDVPTFLWGPRVPFAAQFAQIVREVVADHPDLVCVAVERATAPARITRHLAGDYFHPNDIAYGWIAQAFWDGYSERAPVSS